MGGEGEILTFDGLRVGGLASRGDLDGRCHVIRETQDDLDEVKAVLGSWGL